MYTFASYCVYKTAMMTTNNPILTLAQNIIQSGKLCAKHYTLRRQILCATLIFQTMTCTRQISTLNANCNAAHLAEYMFQTTPSCTRMKICKDCNKSIIHKLSLVSINVNVKYYRMIYVAYNNRYRKQFSRMEHVTFVKLTPLKLLNTDRIF